jgi:hypothetical protein
MQVIRAAHAALVCVVLMCAPMIAMFCLFVDIELWLWCVDFRCDAELRRHTGDGSVRYDLLAGMVAGGSAFVALRDLRSQWRVQWRRTVQWY